MGGFAFFDVDHTLINGSTGAELAREGFREGVIPFSVLLKLPSLYLRYRFGGFNPVILEKLLCLIEGMHIGEIQEMGERVYRQVIRKKIFCEAIEMVEKERKTGREVVLATTSLDCAVKPLAEYLGIEHIISTELELQDGFVTGRFYGFPAFGTGKHHKTMQYLDASSTEPVECSFYSDSYYDLPLLDRVGAPAAVNPDRRLRKEAERRGWPVHRFSQTLGCRGTEGTS